MFRLWCILTVAWVLVSARPVPVPETGALRAVHRQIDTPSASTEWMHVDAGTVQLYALPETAAARELPQLATEVQASLRRVERRLGVQPQTPLELYFVERIFWQGGAAYDEGRVLISYPDRTYTGIPLWAYLDHEITHVLAQQLIPPDGRTNLLLAEGLAVWATGGHYGSEPYHSIAAAIADSDEYVPIRRLLRGFRDARHEVAYVEAGSFVGWLIETRGLPKVKQLYGRAQDPEAVLGRTYTELEREWRAMLALQPVGFQTARRFALQVRTFEALRNYQRAFDPFAREIPATPTGWSVEQRERYQDNLDTPANVALETLLMQIQNDVRCGRLAEAARRLTELEQSVTAEAPMGAEVRVRQEVAEVLHVQDAALGRHDVSAYLDTVVPERRDIVGAFVERHTDGPVQHETAALVVSPDLGRVTVYGWWHGGMRDDVPVELQFEVRDGQWQLVAVRETTVRSPHQCDTLPKVSTIRKHIAWSTSVS